MEHTCNSTRYGSLPIWIIGPILLVLIALSVGIINTLKAERQVLIASAEFLHTVNDDIAKFRDANRLLQHQVTKVATNVAQLRSTVLLHNKALQSHANAIRAMNAYETEKQAKPARR